jgi:hypothetical protein
MRVPGLLMLWACLAAGLAAAQSVAPLAPNASPPNATPGIPAPANTPAGESSASPTNSNPTERHPPNAASPDNVQGSTGQQRQNCKSGQDTTNLNCKQGTGNSPK